MLQGRRNSAQGCTSERHIALGSTNQFTFPSGTASEAILINQNTDLCGQALPQADREQPRG